MVISSSSHMVNNMRFISKALIFSSSMLVLLSATIYAGENKIKSATFISEKFEVGAGTIADKTLNDIEFPRGHLGIKSLNFEVVDEKGISVPIYEAYLHHVFVFKYDEPEVLDPKKPFNGSVPAGNAGVCNDNLLNFHWGMGVESRGTSTKMPGPYAYEVGNPPSGYNEKWLLNIMIIDTRGTKYPKGCTECRCDHFNLPPNHFNETRDLHGKPLNPDYKGGIFCCKDQAQCTLNEGFQATNRTLAIRYKVTWVDWEPLQIPVRLYILDSTDRARTSGSQLIHDCQVEYSIPPSTSLNHSPHVQRAEIPMEKGGYLIYATAHTHTGCLDTSLYRQDGKLLCTSKAKYGTGMEAGNEKDYLVGMSGCYPKPGSVKIKNGEILKLESRYKGEFLTGAMGYMYLWVADELPNGRNSSVESKPRTLVKNHTPKNQSTKKNTKTPRIWGWNF